jgi:transcriptional antiterminator NusG
MVEKTVVEKTGSDQWFVIHTYSGYEEKVEKNLKQRIQTMDMQDRILEVFVPREEEVQIKEGRKTTRKRIVYPGYVMVKMQLTDESWYAVRTTPYVTGFVGADNKPTPLEAHVVDQLKKQAEAEAPRVKVGFTKGHEFGQLVLRDFVFPLKGFRRRRRSVFGIYLREFSLQLSVFCLLALHSLSLLISLTLFYVLLVLFIIFDLCI